ncbi:MAG TPA: acyl-CoA dehydrogenase family protein [Egibacteraceae bacterium]|nr:acyl-CoA dehydrogenase family protein [Egibacteraceae bacterium]
MDFALSPRAQPLLERVQGFIRDEIDPYELERRREMEFGADPWAVSPWVEELKAKAKAQGLWNLFLPDPDQGAGLSNVEYAPLAEAMGRSSVAAEVFNCNAPDSGNMELLHAYGSPAQKERWLRPLLEGEIRSAFCMTEPDVASSDATNMEATAVVDGGEIVLNGRKWWSTGVGHPRCEVLIFMGLTDPAAHKYSQHSMVLVPRDTPGVTVGRMLRTMGFLDAPGGHGEVTFDNVRLPLDHVIGGPGRAFEIAQNRLGPGRIHHCMRLIGLAERALELACERAAGRVAFGKPLANLGGNRERIADARIAIQQARLLVLHAAWLLDTQGLLGALSAVSQIKVAVPNMAQRVVDMAMQIHGGAGLSDDEPFGAMWTTARALRIADGPDEVHRGVVARIELGPYLQRARDAGA